MIRTRWVNTNFSNCVRKVIYVKLSMTLIGITNDLESTFYSSMHITTQTHKVRNAFNTARGRQFCIWTWTSQQAVCPTNEFHITFHCKFNHSTPNSFTQIKKKHFDRNGFSIVYLNSLPMSTVFRFWNSSNRFQWVKLLCLKNINKFFFYLSFSLNLAIQ